MDGTFRYHVIRNLRNFSDEKGHELKVVNYMCKMSHCVIFYYKHLKYLFFYILKHLFAKLKHKLNKLYVAK